MLVGQLSAFANDTIGPIVQAIVLWNRLDEQIRLHVQATKRGVSRYAFQLGLLSAAGFEKADRCRGYIERHGSEPSPDARVRRTLEACRALLAELAEGGADLSSLVDAAIAAYEAGLAMDQESLADGNAALEALRGKVRSRSTDGVARYLGAARYAVVFDRDFRPGATDRRPLAGALGAGIRLVELTLGGADPVQLLEEPVSWAELGITDDVGEARNLLVVTVDVPPDERGTTRYLFAPGPAARNAWNVLNGDGDFDADDTELFWRSLAAKPQLWALPVDPSPALASIGAFDSMILVEYQARLGEIGDTLAALDAALLDATRRLEQIR